jgi:hypothetical protein
MAKTSIYQLISAALLFCVSSAAFGETKPCPSAFQIETPQRERVCLKEFSLANEVLPQQKITLDDIVKKSKCVSIALSNDEKCKAIGVSKRFDSFCGLQDTVRPSRDQEAIDFCQSSGCKCDIAVSEWKMVNEDLFHNWHRNFSAPPTLAKNSATAPPYSDSKTQKQAPDQQHAEEGKTKHHGQVAKILFDLVVTTTEPNAIGEYAVQIQTSAGTESLNIDGIEYGGRRDGSYSIKRVIRVGQTSTFAVLAKDSSGNSASRTITVSRKIIESQAKFAALDPARIRPQPERDAVAIIIGITDYKNLPKAEFASDDARMFYDYATRGLGIKAENIKLLVDDAADDVAIYKAFKTWLPSRVRSSTDIYIFYSGHGLPADNGRSLYLIPHRADRDLIEKTAIRQDDINSYIQIAKPRSVTVFLDSCYSGLARTGESLLGNARPVNIKSEANVFPSNFTVITASQNDQISSSSADLKHGIFSYYLMKGMEGDADKNGDGQITVGEMHSYLTEHVAKQASMFSRAQVPQLIGNPSEILMKK